MVALGRGVKSQGRGAPVMWVWDAVVWGEGRRMRLLGKVAMASGYRGTSFTRNHSPLGPYRRPMPKVLRGS